MRTFMEQIQNAWLESTQWDQDNSYANLNASARELLDFSTPRGARLNVSSLSSANLATSYTLSSLGFVDGSVSYLYTSRALDLVSQSRNVALRSVVTGYRQLQQLRRPDEPWWWEIWQRGRRIDRRDTLLYGRLYLPRSHLEALYMRRLTPTTQLRLSCVSNSSLPSGGTILSVLQRDVGKHNLEGLFSTDSALLGVRGLYNFGPSPAEVTIPGAEADATPAADEVHSRWSAGAEAYYGLLNASGGVSTGLRYTTLPTHPGVPLTMTLALNPLMGNLEGTYAVRAGRDLSLASRFAFNVYSYESSVVLGCELWKRRARTVAAAASLSEQEKEGSVTRSDIFKAPDEEDVQGVLKARVDQNLKIGLLWEGRVKELLFTLGTSLDLKNPERQFSSIGLEVSYSS